MEKSKVLVFFILGLLLTSFLISVVSASSLVNLINGFFQKGFDLGESAKEGLSKFLLMALIIMMVYSIVSFLPFVPAGKEYIGWIISIIVGILAFIYVDPITIRTIVTNYEALGIALTSILPFVIIIVFTYKMREEYPEMASLVNKPLLVLFIIYLIYRWAEMYDKSSKLAIIYFIVAIFSFLWLLAEKWIYFKMFAALRKGDIDQAKQFMINDLAAQLQRKYDQLQTAQGKTYDTLQEEIKKLKDKLEKLKTS